jgi:hypothetical protein
MAGLQSLRVQGLAVTTRLQSPPVPKRRKQDEGQLKRNDAVAKVDAEVIRIAKSVAAFKGITLAEYLSDTLRPIVNRDFDDLHKQRKSRRRPEEEEAGPSSPRS